MVKTEINSLCSYVGLPADCKAYGVFSNLVLQQPLNRLERHREAIGLGAVSYYKPGAECKDEFKAVNRRSKKIQWDYEDDEG